MDGLANTWLFDADVDEVEDNPDAMEPLDEGQLSASEVPMEPDPTVEYSVVPGCYATLAFDDQGRDSYSEQGVRLKYVILQKGENEFLVSVHNSCLMTQHLHTHTIIIIHLFSVLKQFPVYCGDFNFS